MKLIIVFLLVASIIAINGFVQNESGFLPLRIRSSHRGFPRANCVVDDDCIPACKSICRGADDMVCSDFQCYCYVG